MLADDFVGAVAFDALGSQVPGGDDPVHVELEDRIVDDGLDQPAIAPFAFQEMLLCLLALGDVTRHLGEPDDLAAVILDRIDHDRGPEPRAVLAHAPTLGEEAAFLLRHRERPLRKADGLILGGVEP